jgi:integrase
MASIVKRKKSYAVVYTQPHVKGSPRKQKWETYHSLESAEKRKKELENPIAFLGCAPHVNNLEGLLDEYIRLHGRQNWSFSMYSNYTSLMRRYVVPFIGNAKLTQLNSLLMSRFYEQLQHTPTAENKYGPKEVNNLSANTIFEIHQFLRSAFNKAVIWDYLPENPVKHIKMKRPRQDAIGMLEPTQIISVLNKAAQDGNDFMSLVILLAFFASMRKGEIMALKWEDINFDARSITVNKELNRVSLDALTALRNRGVFHVFQPQIKNARTRLVIKTPKTESSIRTVYVPKSLIDALQKWRDQQTDGMKNCRHDYQDYGFVFARKNGLPLQGDELNSGFYKLLKECSLPKAVFHSLRTAAQPTS